MEGVLKLAAINDLEPIMVELDYPDNSSQIKQLPGNFNGVQGDFNVPLDLLFTKNYRPFDLTGFTVGWQQTNTKDEALDVQGTTETISGKGRIRFIFPSNVFAVEGIVTGNFYIMQNTNVRIYGGPMNFRVDENRVQMDINTTPFRTDWETFKASLQSEYDAYATKLKTISDSADGISTELKTANDSANALMQLVKQNAVITETDLDAALANYAKTTSLSSYASESSLTDYVKTSDFAGQFNKQIVISQKYIGTMLQSNSEVNYCNFYKISIGTFVFYLFTCSFITSSNTLAGKTPLVQFPKGSMADVSETPEPLGVNGNFVGFDDQNDTMFLYMQYSTQFFGTWIQYSNAFDSASKG